MTLDAFLAQIKLWSRFPEGTMQYATAVAQRLSESERAILFANLSQAYAEYVRLDEARITHLAKMIEELVHFKQTVLPAFQRKVENAERVKAEHVFDDRS